MIPPPLVKYNLNAHKVEQATEREKVGKKNQETSDNPDGNESIPVLHAF